MNRYLLLMAMVCGCTTAVPMHVQLTVDGDEAFTTAVTQGARTWSHLGLVVDAAPGDVEVVITQRTTLPETGDGSIVGHADLDAMTIDMLSLKSPDHLRHVAAHEMGHLLFGADHLTHPGQRGIMWYSATWEILTPTEDDYALACSEAGYCSRAD